MAAADENEKAHRAEARSRRAAGGTSAEPGGCARLARHGSAKHAGRSRARSGEGAACSRAGWLRRENVRGDARSKAKMGAHRFGDQRGKNSLRTTCRPAVMSCRTCRCAPLPRLNPCNKASQRSSGTRTCSARRSRQITRSEADLTAATGLRSSVVVQERPGLAETPSERDALSARGALSVVGRGPQPSRRRIDERACSAAEGTEAKAPTGGTADLLLCAVNIATDATVATKQPAFSV